MDVQNTKSLKIITRAKLVDFVNDINDYTNYVFLLLDKDDMRRLDTKYLICIQYPNWNHKIIRIGEEGFLQCEEILSGITEWWDGNKFIHHNYDHFHFIKFIPLKEEVNKDEIIL